VWQFSDKVEPCLLCCSYCVVAVLSIAIIPPGAKQVETKWHNNDTVIVTGAIQDKRLIVGSVFPCCAIQKYSGPHLDKDMAMWG